MSFTREDLEFYGDTKFVVQSKFGDFQISTVKLPIDHGYGGKPLWYETMIFKEGDWSDLYCDRYETKEEAVAGHEKAFQWLLNQIEKQGGEA